MSAADTSIKITGEVGNDSNLAKLVAAIVADRPTPGWSDAAIKNEAEALDYVRDVSSSGEAFVFAENERDGECFPGIEAACREIGLAYELTVSVDEEHDTAGHREIYDPATKKLHHLPGVDAGNVPAQDILDLLEGGQTAEAIVRLKFAISPTADLPKEFAVADGLLAAPSARL